MKVVKQIRQQCWIIDLHHYTNAAMFISQ